MEAEPKSHSVMGIWCKWAPTIAMCPSYTNALVLDHP